MLRAVSRALLTLTRYGAVALLGFLLGAIVLYALWVKSGPPLQPWHEVELDQEFTAADAAQLQTLADYRALETRLFQELNDKVFAVTPTGPDSALVRFSPGSAVDPRAREPNWNATFELIPGDAPEDAPRDAPRGAPKGGVLLLHGMSDGPYSLRAIGLALYAQGYRVLGIRLPGHGTAPAGLRSVTAEALTAATRLGMRHLARATGGQPVHVIGYSTGAALAVEVALNGLAGRPDDPPVASLVLVSPAIGVTPMAAFTPVLSTLARLPGLHRLAWTVVLPEFDPFNYTAFSTNAVTQVHRLTRSIGVRLRALAANGPIENFPPTLVLLSTVDRTVSPDAVVDVLFNRLAPGNNELLLYDINRRAITTPLLVQDPGPFTNRLLADPALTFTLTLVANESPDSRVVTARTKPPGAREPVRVETLSGAWPVDAMSLSHVDLPFPPDDPLYGRCAVADGQVCFGGLAIRGEAGVIKVPAQWLMRLRYNPFYDYQERRVLDWISAASPSHPAPGTAP